MSHLLDNETSCNESTYHESLSRRLGRRCSSAISRSEGKADMHSRLRLRVSHSSLPFAIKEVLINSILSCHRQRQWLSSGHPSQVDFDFRGRALGHQRKECLEDHERWLVLRCAVGKFRKKDNSLRCRYRMQYTACERKSESNLKPAENSSVGGQMMMLARILPSQTYSLHKFRFD